MYFFPSWLLCYYFHTFCFYNVAIIFALNVEDATTEFLSDVDGPVTTHFWWPRWTVGGSSGPSEGNNPSEDVSWPLITCQPQHAHFPEPFNSFLYHAPHRGKSAASTVLSISHHFFQMFGATKPVCTSSWYPHLGVKSHITKEWPQVNNFFII